MQINVGMTDTAQQISLSVDLSEAELTELVATHTRPEAGPLRLTDRSGRTLLVAPGRLAYIEILPERTQKVGFGVG